MDYNCINENKKYIRYSQDWYLWLLKVLNKRQLDEIWVAFTKNKFGLFKKSDIEKKTI